MNNLLTRENFRNSVLERDNNKCVVCGNTEGLVAHHILERRLWDDEGYYIDNGATVCKQCHILCEQTVISVEEIRRYSNITKPIIPPHLYDDVIYDKWANVILPNGSRLKGELFEDKSVQKILSHSGVIHKFVDFVKYPRTYHLPWSPGVGKDDRIIESTDIFKDKNVVVTIKMDGENTSMYNNHIHARSLDSQNHESRNWVKNFWGGIKQEIPRGWRICGENLYAKHSIKYTDLKSYFLGFSIWNEYNVCLNWEETLEWFFLLDVYYVPIIYSGIYDEERIKSLYYENPNTEGYVIRSAGSFSYGEFRKNVAKYVRKNHVQTVQHWMHGQRIEKNELRRNEC